MLSTKSHEIVEVQPSTPEQTARALRQHLARHNLRVFLLSLGTLLAAAALWLILYGVCCWLILLALTVVSIFMASRTTNLSPVFTN